MSEGEKALQTSGGNSEATSLIGYAQARAGQPQKALEALDKLRAVQAAGRSEQRVRDRERVAAVAPAADHERDEFVVAERGRAVAQQLLARTIVGRQILHRTTQP